MIQKTLDAVARWRLAIPMGELGPVDRAMIAALLSFGNRLDHDPAVQCALILLERVDDSLHRFLPTCELATDRTAACEAMSYLETARARLLEVQPAACAELLAAAESATVEKPKRKKKPFVPTAEEIEATCLEFQSGWSNRDRIMR